MFLIPAIVLAVEKGKMLPTRAVPKYAFEFSLLFLQLYFAIPVALGYFPRMGSITASELEPEFQQIKSKDGTSFKTEFVFNKGL